MSGDDADRELISVINQRIDVLGALREPRSKRDLVDRLSLSRSTVNRAIRQLESLGLVTRDGNYRLTVAGRLVVSTYESFADDLSDVVRLEGLLTALPPGAPMAVSMVSDADIHWSDAAAPTHILDAAIAEIEDAERIRLMFPRVTRPDILETIRGRIAGDGVPAVVLLRRPVVEYLRDDGEWLDAVGGVDHCRLLAVDNLPYTLGVIQQPDGLHVGIVVYDPDGSVRGFVANDTLRAYAWGEEVFREYQERADPIPESE